MKSPSEQEELSSSFEKTMASCLGACNDQSCQELVQDRETTSQFRYYLANRTPMPVPLQSEERVLRCPPKGSPSAHHIRSRFLHRLGISKTTTSTQTPQPQITTTTPKDTTTGKKCSDSSFQEILKADHGKPGSSSSSTSDTDTTTSSSSSSVMSSSYSSRSSTDTDSAASQQQQKRQRQRRCVHFDDAVTVHPIPSHTLYSERIRSTLWPTALEMQENVARNIVEYTAENWDWRCVVEDEDMVVLCGGGGHHNGGGGERIHPIHFIMAAEQQAQAQQQQQQQQQQQYSMQEHFLSVMAAQQQQQQHYG